MNPGTLDKLRSLPNSSGSNQNWPPGKRQQLTKAVAARFFSLISTNERSLLSMLRDNPDLPPFSQLNAWRTNNDWFRQAWNQANKLRAHFLAEKCADLQFSADPKSAHVVRVRFDIIKWLCAKLHPEQYGDKPLPSQNTTTVNVGVSITPERLSEIRTKLDSTRLSLVPKSRDSSHASTAVSLSRTHRKTRVSSDTAERSKVIKHPNQDVTGDSERMT